MGQAPLLEAEAVEAGVDRNHASQAFFVGHPGDRIDGIVLQIGGDLDQQGRAARQTPQPLNQAPQLAFLLQVAQAGGIGGADVDHGVIRQGGQQLQRTGVIVRGQLQRRHLGLAQVDAQHGRPLAGCRQPLALQGAQHRLGAIVVETHAVERGALGGQAKQPRPRIAALGVPGDGAQLGKAKAKAVPDPGCHGIFVKAGGQSQRIGKAAAKQALLQAGIAALQVGRQTRQHTADPRPAATQRGLGQRRQGQLAELLGIGTVVAAEQGSHQTAVKRSGTGGSHGPICLSHPHRAPPRVQPQAASGPHRAVQPTNRASASAARAWRSGLRVARAAGPAPPG